MTEHAALLGALTRAEPDALKALAEAVLPELGAVEVVRSRTGLVMLPMRDPVRGADFHLGEVLVAEAHVRLPDRGAEGYGVVIGRDLERAMAVALLDAAAEAGVRAGEVDRFARAQTERLAAEDDAALRRVEATRVEMETF